MSVDSRVKRMASICVGLMFRPLPSADGLVGDSDRAVLAYCYSFFVTPTPTEPVIKVYGELASKAFTGELILKAFTGELAQKARTGNLT